MAGGQPNWTVAIQAWWDEIHLWKYGPEPDTYLGYNGWLKVGHFTQVYNSNNKLHTSKLQTGIQQKFLTTHMYTTELANYRQVYNSNSKLHKALTAIANYTQVYNNKSKLHIGVQ